MSRVRGVCDECYPARSSFVTLSKYKVLKAGQVTPMIQYTDRQIDITYSEQAYYIFKIFAEICMKDPTTFKTTMLVQELKVIG